MKYLAEVGGGGMPQLTFDITRHYKAKHLNCVCLSMYFPQSVHSSPNLAVQSNQLFNRLYKSIFFPSIESGPFTTHACIFIDPL